MHLTMNKGYLTRWTKYV